MTTPLAISDLPDSEPPAVIPFPDLSAGGSGSASAPTRTMVADPLGGEARVIIACSESLLAVSAKAKRIARSKIPVLIEGETGTGKELIARLIHEHSPRAGQRFVEVNCAALPDHLVESELFGHEKGAFTGADQRHRGYFERADRGSLMLDEVGEMPLAMQAKLLRVLEEETFARVGGEQIIKTDVRIIATTNRSLEREVGEHRFRGDLFYRLNALTLHLTPLRERREEIPHLVRHFIEQFGGQGVVTVAEISHRALQCLMDYNWPGNIRQLRNVIQHACAVAQDERIDVADLPELPRSSVLLGRKAAQTLAEIERDAILETLREFGGNRTAAAARLGVTPRTLHNKLKLYRQSEAA
ncbi:MAG: sigma-54-dependent Fis family transcriptional regulator [Planctomycetes bacterium]|nr:sigma-54-dependent Fis family transcriptional regulator [Planctomycetota bacterium]